MQLVWEKGLQSLFYSVSRLCALQTQTLILHARRLRGVAYLIV